MRIPKGFVFAVAAIATIGTAKAGLIGATVTVDGFFQNSETVTAPGGSAVVSGAVEYPAGSFGPIFSESWEVDITDSQMIVTNAGLNGFPFFTGTFNGFILTVVSGPALISASVNAGSQFSPVSVTVVGNQVQVNFQGVTGTNTAAISSIIDIVTEGAPVPEPATWFTTLGAGVMLAGLRAYRARRGRA